MYAVTEVIEDIDIIPFEKVVKKKDLPEKSGFSFYPNRHDNRFRETRLPDIQRELPVDEWIMPDQPHGYIKGRDNDLL
jgi:hypothetical protein